MKKNRVVCVAGGAIFCLSMMALEGGALGLAAGSILAIAGGMLVLATMRETGWFYEA